MLKTYSNRNVPLVGVSKNASYFSRSEYSLSRHLSPHTPIHVLQTQKLLHCHNTLSQWLLLGPYTPSPTPLYNLYNHRTPYSFYLNSFIQPPHPHPLYGSTVSPTSHIQLTEHRADALSSCKGLVLPYSTLKPCII